jgi:hypothetical protein
MKCVSLKEQGLRMLIENRLWTFLLATICYLLTACATTGKYEDSLSSWKGSSDAELIKTWGQPTETFSSNGHTFFVYRFSRTKPLSVIADPAGSHGDHLQALFCTTVFDTSQGRVLDWAIKGNDCQDVSRPSLWKTAF